MNSNHGDFAKMNLRNKKNWNQFFSTEKIKSLKSDDWLEKWGYILQQATNGVLDLGCGNGANYDILKRYIPTDKLHGIDYSIEGVAKACEKHTEIDTQVADFTEGLSFADESLDIVIADLSLHYLLNAQRNETLKEIKRVLKPGGILLGRVNAVGDSIHTQEKTILEENAYLQTDGTIKNTFTLQGWKQILEEYFSNVEVKEETTLKYTNTKHLLEFIAYKD